jgi:uncharacterized protein (TIGR00251 family)
LPTSWRDGRVVSVTPSGVRLAVRVTPRAARERVVGRHGGSLKVQVSAPPVDGAANQAVIALLARWLELPRRAFTIVSGHSSRDKIIAVASTDPAALAQQIAARADRVDIAGGAD